VRTRFKLSLEYAGTRYRGWQIQKNARTVQGELADAVKAVCGARTDFELYGSGRTDAGVHALLQVAHLDVVTHLPPPKLRIALNDVLPPDINVLAVERVSSRFHARHGAKGRSYLYQISRRRTAFAKPFVWWVKDELDAAAMRSCARLFLGMNDFQSFTDDDPEEKSTAVLVERVEVAEEGDLILVRIAGSHFVWKMVRRIVGVLVAVGRGELREADVAQFLKTPSETPAKLTAPPSGLFLERVRYEGDPEEPPPLRAVMSLGFSTAPARGALPPKRG
jgi:tRNA pseudouridine38-40 synthase